MPALGFARGRLGPWLAAFLVALAVLLAWSAAFHPPVWDDHYFVRGQPFLSRCGNLAAALDPASLWTPLPVSNSARPVWLASVLLDRCWAGDWYPAHRLASAFWHGAGAAALAALAFALSADAAAAALAGILFVCHPLHAEPVNIVTFRADLLAFFFGAAALLARERARGLGGPAGLAGSGAALFLAALALLSKESATALPALSLLLERRFPERPLLRRAAFPAALALLSLAYLAFRAPRSGYVNEGWSDALTAAYRAAARPAGEAASPAAESTSARYLPDAPPWMALARGPARLYSAAAASGKSLRMIFLPDRLQSDYALRVVESWRDAGFLAAAGAWLLLFSLAWALRWAAPEASLGLLFIPAAMLPVLGIVQMKNPVAERYLYAPSAGLCLAAAFLLVPRAGNPARRRSGIAAGLGLALLWAGWTLRRNADFRGDLELFSAAVARDPEVPRSRLNLALALADRGRRAEADEHFRAALRLWPGSRRARERYRIFLSGEDAF